jgi:hypothetical protein
MPPTKDIYVHTHTGEDLIEVVDVECIDSGGFNQPHPKAADACIDIQPTCADQGEDLWPWLKSQIKDRLDSANIPWDTITIDREP